MSWMRDFMFDEAISKLEVYKTERVVQPDIRQQAYSEWAIDEMLARLILETDKNPICLYREGQYTPKEIIEEFYLEMEYYEDTSETIRQRLIFNIARREAEHVLTIL